MEGALRVLFCFIRGNDINLKKPKIDDIPGVVFAS